LFGTGGVSGLSGEIASIAELMRQLRTDEEAVLAPAASSGSSTGGSSIADTVLGAVGDAFGGGLSPLVSGLAGLFGSGGSSEVAQLMPYMAPPSVNVNAGISGGAAGVFAADTADGGMPRPAPAAQNAAAQITVQVQAMDSQSFLDHSNDIAMAVRQAMLESSSLNDVIRDV
jgi:hypothetical protein